MAEVYVVTGLMRSGTSFLAETLHRQGIPMGTFMRFPSLNPKSGFEWEDAFLSEPLCQIAMRHLDTPDDLVSAFRDAKEVIGNYVSRREAEGAFPWGVKTPFVLPFLGSLRDAVETAGHSLNVFLTNREYADTLKSLELQFDHLEGKALEAVRSSSMRIQDKLARSWQPTRDGAEIFDCKESQDNSDAVIARVARLIGKE